jgi:phosphopantetheinyl transferase
MLILNQHTPNGALLGVWKMEESHEKLLQLFPEKFRAETLEDVEKIRAEQRAVEWLTTRIMLYTLLGEEKKIVKKETGQPYLSDNSYRISISHTKKYAAILLHPTLPVGVDIETISERVKKIAYKFISDNEYIDPSQEIVHQLLHWSAKESLFKLISESEIDFKQHLHIEPFTPLSEGLIRAKETKSSDEKSFTIHYKVREDYVMTWVVG